VENHPTDFESIVQHILDHEGGYVDDPTDRGGETNFGIAKRFYPDVDIKNLTVDQAKQIYFQDYWGPSKAQDLRPEIRFIYFDMVVNFGIGGAVKVLQRTCNAKRKEDKLKIDGKIGPNTINACKNISVNRIRSYRVLRFASIVFKRPEQERFWFGWYRRATQV
jgi:lysozyme family protein